MLKPSVMPRHSLMNAIFELFSNSEVLTLEDVSARILDQYPTVSAGEFKSAMLGLLQRGDLILREDFTLSAPRPAVAA